MLSKSLCTAISLVCRAKKVVSQLDCLLGPSVLPLVSAFSQVIVNWKLVDLSDRDLAMLEFALAVRQADNITEEHFQKLERHGFDHEDAWDIGMISAFFAMSNCIAHYIDLRPNTEFYTVGRMSCGQKEKEGAECACHGSLMPTHLKD